MGLLNIFLLLYKGGLFGGWCYNQVSFQGAIFHHQVDHIEAMPQCRKKIIHVFNRVWWSNFFQFLSIHAKGISFGPGRGLKEVASIWKREDQHPALFVFSLVPPIEGIPYLRSGSKEAPIMYASRNFGVPPGLTTLIQVPWAFVLFLYLSSLPPRDR